MRGEHRGPWRVMALMGARPARPRGEGARVELSNGTNRIASRQRLLAHAQTDQTWIGVEDETPVFNRPAEERVADAPDRASEAETCRARATELQHQAARATTDEDRAALEIMAKNWADLAIHIGKREGRDAGARQPDFDQV
jgi:hypothetical protein